ARTDIVALAQAKAEIRALVERDFNRKSTRGRKRHARFLEDHTAGSPSGAVGAEIVSARDPRETQPHPAEDTGERPKPPAEPGRPPEPQAARRDAFAD